MADALDELAARRRQNEVAAAGKAFGYCAPCRAVMERAARLAVPFGMAELCNRDQQAIRDAIAAAPAIDWTAPVPFLPPPAEPPMHPMCRCVATPLGPPAPAAPLSWWRRLLAPVRWLRVRFWLWRARRSDRRRWRERGLAGGVRRDR